MWINVGMSQFHLPMGAPDVLRGVVGLVSSDRTALLDRLTRVRKSKQLDGTKFDFRESNDRIETVCPWGNRMHVHTPDRRAIRGPQERRRPGGACPGRRAAVFLFP